MLKTETSGGDPNDPCSPNPCKNDGECADLGDGEVFCFCLDGFKGEFCEIGKIAFLLKEKYWFR